MTYGNQQTYLAPSTDNYGQIASAAEAGVVTPEIMEAPQPGSVISLQERVGYDIAIETAHRHPRNIDAFIKNATRLAMQDEDVAESCIYRRPVGKDKNGRQTFAEGMSVRLAEIVAACYGNIKIGVQLIEDTPSRVIVQAVAHDLENNNFQTAQVVESTLNRDKKPYDERMRVVIIKAAQAKARRDAIFMVVPRALAKPIENAARSILYGTAESLDKRRERVKGWIAKLGIEPERVFAALGIHGIVEMGAEQLEVLTGLKSAIQSGDVSIDEAFPPVKVDKFAKAAEQAASEKNMPPADQDAGKKAKKTPPVEPAAAGAELKLE